MKPTTATLFGVMLLLSSSWITCHAKRRKKANKKNNCSPEKIVLAFYAMEIVLGSDAVLCRPKEQIATSELLTQLLNNAFAKVPGLIEADAALCARPKNSRRRVLLTTTNELPSFLPKHNIVNQSSATTLSKIRHNGLPAFATGEETFPSFHRSLNRHGVFIYQGGMRCRFCPRDMSDMRRGLQCRQGKQLLFRGDSRTYKTWKNVQTFKIHRTTIMGPFVAGKRASKTISVPSGTSFVSIRFKILQDQLGTGWGRGDKFLISIDNQEVIVDTPERSQGNPVYQTYSMDGFSVLVKFLRKSGKIVSTKVRLEIQPSTYQKRRKFNFGVGVKSTNGSRDKKAGVAFMEIEGTQTCSSGDSGSKSNTSFEERMEKKLSNSLTNDFKSHSNIRCFRDKNPRIYVNLFEKDSIAAATPKCPKL